MTQFGNERIVGVDVSKDRLDLYDWDSKCPDSIANDIDAIDRWLDGFSLPVRFAIEPTNQFHIALAERAHARGHAIFRQGTYRNADAFMGMDVRARQSGRWKGKSKLTKKGDPEVRRLLFNAAMQAQRNPLWEPYCLALRERGFSTTAAFVALGRKLARVAFALLQKNVDFDPKLHMTG